MAYAMKPERTFFVLIGSPRLFTDVSGISYIVPDNKADMGRGELYECLRTAECAVNDGRAWINTTNGDFESCCDKLPEASTWDPFLNG